MNAIWFILLKIAIVISAPTDEFMQLMGNKADIEINDEPFSTITYIVPAGLPGHKIEKEEYLSDYIDEDKLKSFNQFIKKGYTNKALTFNIYDDNMREATISLYNLMRQINNEVLTKVLTWLTKHINNDMLQYAKKLLMLYDYKPSQIKEVLPYAENPKYFTNADTIVKANYIKFNNGNFDQDYGIANQVFKRENRVYINTNYSGWNLMDNGFEENLNYFREDVGLNSFYYGIHLLHPFWMSNKELDEINPRQAEHYFYSHQQLYARYLLEKQHLDQENSIKLEKEDYTGYDPYLRYENGLSFPIRYEKLEKCLDRSRLISTHISITECISRGFVMMKNGTRIRLSEDNHTELIAKLIRANFDNTKTAKVIRSLCGANGYPADAYNPAPSVLHHPQTTLREPVYWKMMERVLQYVFDYRNNFVKPFDLSDYEEDIRIVGENLSNITTYFQYFDYQIGRGLANPCFEEWCKNEVIYAARQRRLQHEMFSFKFNVESTVAKRVVVRLFIGPPCENEQCFNQYSKFFELDNFVSKLREGPNVLIWTPSTSQSLSNDYTYSMFKFPERLIIPKGTEEGVKLKLFIIINDADDKKEYTTDNLEKTSLYKTVCFENDDKPLGFPFHRAANNYSLEANNYRFYDIHVYHKKKPIDSTGYFSSHLY